MALNEIQSHFQLWVQPRNGPWIPVSVQTVEGDHQTRVVDEELPPVTWLKKLETLNEHHHNLNETLKLTVKSDRVVQLSSLFSDYSIESSTFDSQNQIHFSLPQNQHISVRNHEHILLINCESKKWQDSTKFLIKKIILSNLATLPSFNLDG